ncbi:ABC transporter ATP-binding protein [Falsibacillus albus]|uniref:ATP-binding cassette domain-containing protein n=1 Tax=Falsibacillus albus TaxID=2478915 RepID=A0A3L7JXR4_9BACI|nr:ABC transporter ATP-binding protein [Falsibacillus albus]RLQ93222.1 ATP-binding cassette domain-containing protein [Falsibacillus albus]
MSSMGELKKLRLKFPGDEKLLFKDLDLSFQQGEKVLIIGPSGCGKSTLLQVLSGIVPEFHEMPMKAEKVKCPESWGYIFQDPDAQFCMPYVDEELAFVLENLQVPREQMEARILELLRMVGLNLEDSHTEIQTLSGGMKQRLAIASALALEPDVLFLDEPTAMLDPEGTESIWETIKSVGGDKTLVIVEHKLDHVLDIVDRIVMFDENGHIQADGEPEIILSRYQTELTEQGIWHPEAWEDYLNNRSMETTEPMEEEILELREFRGFHGRKEGVYIEEAHIKKGEWIGIVGRNGAGKSTLLHSLMRLIPTSGHYWIKGRKASGIKRLADEVTFVFQNPEYQFVSHSVYEEIAYTLRVGGKEPAYIDQKVEEMLKMFHLSEVRMQHPYQLSMGQKRRLSVAAAVVDEPSIMLLDEPTFGQDARNTFAILEMIDYWRKRGTTILMVTHSPEIVDHFVTRVWEIEKGQLIRDEIKHEKGKEKVVVG